MIFGKRALALQARRHRRAEQFREFLERRPRAREVNSLPRVNHRLFRVHKRGGRPAHLRGIGPVAGRDRRLVRERLGHLFGEQIHRNLDQRGASASIAQARKCAAEDVRNLSRQDDRLGGFRDRAHAGHGIEIRIDVRDATRVTHRQHENRHRLAVRLRHAAERIFGAGPVLHRENADSAPARQARHRVRHVQPHALLPDDDRPNARLRRRLDNVVHRVAEKDFHAFAL